MSPESVDLLLRKQRLQLQVAQQRQACIGILQNVESGFAKLESLQAVAQNLGKSLRRHAAGLSVASLLLLLWRPRGVLRWLRRGWLVYWGAKRLRTSLNAVLAVARGAFSD